MTGTTLALDLGQHLGYALRWQHGYIESGSADFGNERSDCDGMRFLRFRSWLHDTKQRVETLGSEIGLVLFERVDFIRPGQVYAAHSWGAYWGTLVAWGAHHQIECRGVAVATIKKSVCGSGRAKKPEIIRAVRARGYAPKDSNEADALALLLTAGGNDGMALAS